MSRETKFRAWNKKLKQMGEVFQLDFEAKGVWVKFYNPKINLNEADFWEDKDIILEQYIDRKDKNGKEIYENSEVKHDNHIRPVGEFKVTWDKYKAGWVLSGIRKDKSMWLKDWSVDFVEVIGTIHDKEQP